MQPVIVDTEEGRVSYVTKETIERLKTEGFDIVHPLVGIKARIDGDTGETQIIVDTNDLLVLFLRSR